MFKITIIAMAIVLIIGIVVRIFDEMEKPKEEGEHRKRIDRASEDK